MPCHLPNGARDFVLIPTLHDVRATAFRGNCLSGWEDQWNVNTEFAAMEIARAADICVSPTPMRLTGLISPMERSEDQEPPPRAAGPYFIVLFGTEEGIDGVVCGIWKDM
ncbi:hypothetical protein NM688_g7529 [Phlebia brevispora]|uniref:Uncharacterized protein n=1 Tax=Phlebia brevispora TaxID=194682 RepID=A0ACC1S4A4_9APHY|nr:hypothetical protein NM688_g7529 [Phlebia brevispora]